MAPQAGPTPEEVASECLPGAILTGLKAAAISLVLSCGIFYAVHRNSALFRSLNVSGKTSLVVLPVFFNGYQAIEGAMQDCVKQHRSTEHAKRMQEQENS